MQGKRILSIRQHQSQQAWLNRINDCLLKIILAWVHTAWQTGWTINSRLAGITQIWYCVKTNLDAFGLDETLIVRKACREQGNHHLSHRGGKKGSSWCHCGTYGARFQLCSQRGHQCLSRSQSVAEHQTPSISSMHCCIWLRMVSRSAWWRRPCPGSTHSNE